MISECLVTSVDHLSSECIGFHVFVTFCIYQHSRLGPFECLSAIFSEVVIFDFSKHFFLLSLLPISGSRYCGTKFSIDWFERWSSWIDVSVSLIALKDTLTTHLRSCNRIPATTLSFFALASFVFILFSSLYSLIIMLCLFLFDCSPLIDWSIIDHNFIVMYSCWNFWNFSFAIKVQRLFVFDRN